MQNNRLLRDLFVLWECLVICVPYVGTFSSFPCKGLQNVWTERRMQCATAFWSELEHNSSCFFPLPRDSSDPHPVNQPGGGVCELCRSHNFVLRFLPRIKTRMQTPQPHVSTIVLWRVPAYVPLSANIPTHGAQIAIRASNLKKTKVLPDVTMSRILSLGKIFDRRSGDGSTSPSERMVGRNRLLEDKSKHEPKRTQKKVKVQHPTPQPPP